MLRIDPRNTHEIELWTEVYSDRSRIRHDRGAPSVTEIQAIEGVACEAADRAVRLLQERTEPAPEPAPAPAPAQVRGDLHPRCLVPGALVVLGPARVEERYSLARELVTVSDFELAVLQPQAAMCVRYDLTDANGKTWLVIVKRDPTTGEFELLDDVSPPNDHPLPYLRKVLSISPPRE